MYTFNYAGDTAEIWFNDVDEWEIAYAVEDRAESEKVCDMALTIDYHEEIPGPNDEMSENGRWLLLCMNVTDMARLEAIMQEEWCYYEKEVAELTADGR